MKIKYLILMLAFLAVPFNANAAGCYCSWVDFSPKALLPQVGNVTNVANVANAFINEAQILQLVKAIGNASTAIKGQTELSAKTMQEMMKFNNTALIEAMKDIKKAEKIAEKMEYVNTISKDLCDEPDVAASVQNGYKAASKISGSSASNAIKNLQNTSETELEKKIAEIDLKDKDITKAFKSILDDEGMAHRRNMQAITMNNFTNAINNVQKEIANADAVAKQSLKAKANILTYEAGAAAISGAEFEKHHAPTIEKTDSIKTLIDNISGGKNGGKEVIEEFKEDKLSLISYAKLRSLQSVLDPEAALERINTNQNSLLGEINLTLQQMLYWQIYMVEMMERMEAKMLAVPNPAPDKSIYDK